MSKRTVFWVVPHGSLWGIKREDGVISNTYDTKEEAKFVATRLAHENRPSQLKVQLMDGTIEYESTFGDDPYPPKG